ncbi:MAG: FadR family transcriptional regulator [Treponema sp.]|jgi:DNA-binding FadR family transcriptional regulator|nr:FadR family transcriptional regulator [Treponema sp.]
MTDLAQPKLSERLALEIRKLIVEGRLKPGDRFLSENTLIGRYRVGRSTIREAIKLLVAENVVEIHHGKGTFICERTGVTSDPLGLKYTDQTRLLLSLFETRLIVEPQMTLLAARRATAGDMIRLERIIASFGDSDADTGARFPSLDVAFHSALANCTKNEVLYRFLPSICDAIWKGRDETADNVASHEKARVCHQKIFLAVRDRRPEEAAREMIKHIKQTAKDMNIILGGVL